MPSLRIIGGRPPSGAGRTRPPAPSDAAIRQCARQPGTGSRPRRSGPSRAGRPAPGRRGSPAASALKNSLSDAPVSSPVASLRRRRSSPWIAPQGQAIAVAAPWPAGKRALRRRPRRSACAARRPRFFLSSLTNGSGVSGRVLAFASASSASARAASNPRCRGLGDPRGKDLRSARLCRRRAPYFRGRLLALGPQRQQISIVDNQIVSIRYAKAICDRPLSTSDRQAAVMAWAFSGDRRNGTCASRL